MQAAVRLTPEQVLDQVRQSPADKVKVAITDIDGVLRGKYIHKDKFMSAINGGFGFCNVIFGWDCNDVCYDNGQYTGWHTGYPDAQANLDLTTFRRVPWDDNVPFFLADFNDGQGKPLGVCPRQLLKGVVARAADMGFKAKFGLEFEWFNFRETPQSLRQKAFVGLEPITPGMFGYSVLRAGQNQPFVQALFDELNKFGVPLEGLHTETGPGVYEGAILVADPVEAADRAVLFKSAAKEIAHRFGIVASFMAKWNNQLPGCGGHMHQSLWDKSDNPTFHDAADKRHMSQTFKHYLAGQMHCLPEILPMYAPNVNSYKRLVDGHWAPTRVAWGCDNRTTALRVIAGSAKSTRLETRVGGADINPYIAVAAAMASGLYGIAKKLDLPSDAIVGSAYTAHNAPQLPRNLLTATERMQASKLAVDLFGQEFVQHYTDSRIWEWRQFQQAVTSWELDRYFEVI